MNTNLIKQSVKLIVCEDQSTGETGFKIEGVPVIDAPMVALQGLLIAHDLLEHVQGVTSIGTVQDELLAEGGIWFVRGQMGDITRRPSMHTPMEHLAADVVNMGALYLCNTSIRVNTGNEQESYDIEETAQEFIEMCRPKIRDEMNGEPIDNDRLDHYMSCVYHLMCQGYELASKRFNDNSCFANTMFWRIAEAFDNAIKHMEMYEGAWLTLNYCLESGEVSVIEAELWELEGCDSAEEYEEMYC